MSVTLADSLLLGLAIGESHDGEMILDLARWIEFTIYDDAHLEVASRPRLSSATLDRQLNEAARAVGVALCCHKA